MILLAVVLTGGCTSLDFSLRNEALVMEVARQAGRLERVRVHFVQTASGSVSFAHRSGRFQYGTGQEFAVIEFDPTHPLFRAMKGAPSPTDWLFRHELAHIVDMDGLLITRRVFYYQRNLSLEQRRRVVDTCLAGPVGVFLAQWATTGMRRDLNSELAKLKSPKWWEYQAGGNIDDLNGAIRELFAGVVDGQLDSRHVEALFGRVNMELLRAARVYIDRVCRDERHPLIVHYRQQAKHQGVSIRGEGRNRRSIDHSMIRIYPIYSGMPKPIPLHTDWPKRPLLQ